MQIDVSLAPCIPQEASMSRHVVQPGVSQANKFRIALSLLRAKKLEDMCPATICVLLVMQQLRSRKE